MTRPPPSQDPVELALVVKAITLRVNGCCNWHRGAMERFLKDPEVAELGLTPEGLPGLLADHADSGEAIIQKPQDNEWDGDCRYWYAIRLRFDPHPKRLFTKLVLRDDDPDYPVVEIVSCHF